MVASYELYDDVAWDRGEAMFDAIKEKILNEDLYHEIARFVTTHRKGGSPMTFFPPERGGFNYFYRIQYSDMQSVIIRFPLPGFFRIAEEKLLAEVATLRYLADHTTIPVPFVLHHGMADESPGGLGPFIIMEYIEHTGDLFHVMRTPDSLSKEKFAYIFSQVADFMLQLARCEFSKIGSLGMRRTSGADCDEDDHVEITGRPFSYNLAMLGEVGGIPFFELPEPSKTFDTSNEYYSALADMHLQQLSFQRNQAIRSADECRKKYIARQLFRRIAAEHRVASQESNAGPFKLWCDDLRATNFLVDDDFRIVGVVDWEFSYAAPPEFSHSPPWWLLGVMPEEWPKGLADWSVTYDARLEDFLNALEAKEKEFLENERLNESQTLSKHLRRSWCTGDFWLTYAARKSWAFDGIFWRSLYPRFFGEADAECTAGLEFLPLRQVTALESFGQRKLEEKEAETLIDWYADDARFLLPPDILQEGVLRREANRCRLSGDSTKSDI